MLKLVKKGLRAAADTTTDLVCHPRRFFKDPQKPPWVSEYYVNCLWLENSGFYDKKPTPPLLAEDTGADIVIVGGGYTGLSSAYHLVKRFPQKKIILLEAARCGYGGSGRNGGFAIIVPPTVLEIYKKYGLKEAQHYNRLSRDGFAFIQNLSSEYGIECDIVEKGRPWLAETQGRVRAYNKQTKIWDRLGIENQMISKQEIRRKIDSNLPEGALWTNTMATLNPAKLALGLKEVVQDLGVEIYEQTKVQSIQEGPEIKLETEFGTVRTPHLVMGLNGYASTLDFKMNRTFSCTNHVIATEPISPDLIQSMGWNEWSAMETPLPDFNYISVTTDNRIVIGGSGAPYFTGNQISSGNYKPILARLEEKLLKIWPQLKGTKITHKWGGTVCITMDTIPTMGITGKHQNIFFAQGYTGEGVVWGMESGKIISHLYAGDDCRETRSALVTRKPPYIPPEPFRKIGYEIAMKATMKTNKMNK